MPLVLKTEGLDQIVLKQLGLPLTEARTAAWEELVDRIKHPVDELTIHVVGKYTGYEDSYKSLNEAVYHGGFAHRLKVRLNWVEAEALEREGGARCSRRARHPGARRIRLARHARHDEGRRIRARAQASRSSASATASSGRRSSTRNVCGLEGADSTEVDENAPHKVIYKLRDLLGVDDLGGTMRLGRYACELKRPVAGGTRLRHG